MKKLICIVMVIIFAFSFSACGGNDAENKDSKKSNYTISKELTILAEYLKVSNTGFGKHFFAFVKNNSTDTIVDYSIAYIGFDINGNVTDANTGGNKYGEEKITMANILPNAVYGLSDGSTEGIYVGDDNAVRYVKSAVSYIKFKSGEEWKMDDLDAWAEDTIKNFSVEEEKNYSQSLKSDAEKAMVNPYLSILNSRTTANGNSFYDALNLEFTIKNIGDKKIKSCSIIILEYEDGNKGIKLPNQMWNFNYQYITNNSYKIDIELPSNQQEELPFVAEAALVGNCKDCLLIVERIEFEDDTVWNNDYALQFMIYNENSKLI